MRHRGCPRNCKRYESPHDATAHAGRRGDGAKAPTVSQETCLEGSAPPRGAFPELHDNRAG
ncbi:hypothetical protein OF001_U30081 [Pseudomonas sp. OF001]|nr:hypothetical protein OF001_U30081 [Pseudomonas sp. OF001]